MRIINSVGAVNTQVGANNVVFDDKRELRSYVRDAVIGTAELLRNQLGFVARMLLSDETITKAITAAFNKYWPVGATEIPS